VGNQLEIPITSSKNIPNGQEEIKANEEPMAAEKSTAVNSRSKEDDEWAYLNEAA